MAIINSLAKRLDQLERDRTESPPRQLRYGGLWLGVPLLFAVAGLAIRFGRERFDRAGAGALWVSFVLVVTTLVLGCSAYQRRVPIKAQVVVDLIAWLMLAWMFFYFRFWDL